MIQVMAHMEDPGGGVCPCGAIGSRSLLVLRIGNEVSSIGPLCDVCMQGQQHTAWVEPPAISAGGPPTKRMKRASKLQEKRMSDGVGARATLASGAMASDKSDARIQGVLRIENKFTYGTTFALSRQVLNKIRSECVGHETPVLEVEFKDRATNKTQDAWVCLPHKVWERLFNATSENR